MHSPLLPPPSFHPLTYPQKVKKKSTINRNYQKMDNINIKGWIYTLYNNNLAYNSTPSQSHKTNSFKMYDEIQLKLQYSFSRLCTLQNTFSSCTLFFSEKCSRKKYRWCSQATLSCGRVHSGLPMTHSLHVFDTLKLKFTLFRFVLCVELTL